ncbi:MAG TPA: alpha/beta fold hydrolase [Chryseolinea sp.]|nr:alpha/beta fold hydrolase [Chryseolinea sp.]
MRYFEVLDWAAFRVRTFAAVAVALSFSCDDNSPSPEPPANEKLVEATLLYTASASQLQFLAQFSGFDLDVDEINYDAEVYKVIYKTTFQDNEISASGLVVLPKTSDEVGMLSFHHGTITDHDDAPTNLSEADSDALLYAALSSTGFITVIPDYLGFGSSSSILHPYYVEEYSASAVIDLLTAASELSADEDIHFNKKLFLAGYSEGGYVTMATHKAIEEQGLEGFDLIASFPAAGGYDISGMQNYLLGKVTYDDPSYIAYVIRAYQVSYDFSDALTDFFKPPYADRIPGLFDGTKGTSEINSQLTTVLADLLQEGLFEKLNSDPEYSYIKNAFIENSLTDWKPIAKMYMYHGESDVTVPYQNSVDTYNKLISNGTSNSSLTFLKLSGDHASAIQPYIMDFVPKLWALR